MRWLLSKFGYVVYTERRAQTIMGRAQKALDALEVQGEDGLHTARSYLYDLIHLLSLNAR